MKKQTFIDGIASSQALDTSGEIVELKGLDTSSLIGAALNWEHEHKLPSQIVGKILEAHKIFSKEDCQNDRHKHFWEKIQLPFLYIKGRLFDDKKPSAVEVAALFQDDAEHPNEAPMVSFSVEGARIEKVGAVITRSIARKVTITGTAANKTCVAEMLPEKKSKAKDDIDELFKGEMELFSFEPSYVELMEKGELKKDGPPPMNLFNPSTLPKTSAQPIPAPVVAGVQSSALGKKEALKKDVGSGGGAFIGSQMAMSEDLEKSLPNGWSGKVLGNEGSFSHSKHGSVRVSKMPMGNFEVRHNDKLVGVSPSISHAGEHAKKYMGKLSKEEKLEKALDAGSMMAAPSQLVGGAALGKESLDRRTHKANSMKKAEKSKWYSKADEAYNTWDKRPHFKDYMKKRMPHLAEGEVDAIGRVLALKKTLQAEGKLSKMYASYFNKSEMEKGSDVMMASEEYIHGLPKGHPALGEHKGYTYRRISPPTKLNNHWSWAIKHPSGQNTKFHAPAESAGSRDSVHQHIESLASRK